MLCSFRPVPSGRKQESTMAASGSDKAKLIIVGAILIVAVGWIA
jgi:hypothetical protein